MPTHIPTSSHTTGQWSLKMKMRFFGGKGASGFSANSTAEEVTDGIDATGLAAVVTGGASGIGAETARVLALRGAHVIIGDKNLAAGLQTRESILKQIPSAKVDVKELDLSSMVSVRNFAKQFISTGLPVNLLINNAGVMGVPYKLSVDNIELHFATNHVGHFLLTDLFLDTMKKTAQESKIQGRIVNVGSMAHFTTYPEGIRFDKINEEASYRPFSAYCVSKLASILHANELSRRLKDEGADVTANSLHPGFVYTKIVDHYPFMETTIMRFVKMISAFFIKDIHQGAATTCYAALHPQVRGVSGKYFSDCNLSEPWAQATDMDLAKKLWDFTSNLIKDTSLLD
uniref:Short-chain dehydrogenase/reductase n=2 Tax=Kalanchoe fedtschenkoi TaxID=63787 RepID=A0A7N0U5J9_KALFE